MNVKEKENVNDYTVFMGNPVYPFHTFRLFICKNEDDKRATNS